MDRPTSPPLFSPTHRPILATSASFRRDHLPASPSPSRPAVKSSTVSNVMLGSDDPWRDNEDSPRPANTRSVSEGHKTSFAGPSSNGIASTPAKPRQRVPEADDVFSSHSQDASHAVRDTVALGLPAMSPQTSKGKGKATDGLHLDRPTLVEKVSIWASMVETSNGRDKILKLFQYSARTYLYAHVLVAMLRKAPPQQRRHMDRLRTMIGGLSLTRKCLLLFNFLSPLSHLLSSEPLPGATFSMHILSLFNGLADDIFCLSRLGVISKRRGRWADKWSNRLWLLTSIIGLIKLYTTQLPVLTSAALIERSETAARPSPRGKSSSSSTDKALRDARWTARKLWCDVVFASYDVLDIQAFKEPVLCITGLTAGLISTSKLYEKHSIKVKKELGRS